MILALLNGQWQIGLVSVKSVASEESRRALVSSTSSRYVHTRVTINKTPASYSLPIQPPIYYAWTFETAGSSTGTKVSEKTFPLLVLMIRRSVWFH